MTNVIKIAISGKAASGKTTLAKAIVKYFKINGWVTVQKSLAQPLKKSAEELWPRTRGTKDRDLLFALGKAVIEIDQYTFCNAHEWAVNKAIEGIGKPANGILVIVDDMRMPWEYEFFGHQGYIRLRTECGQNKRIHRYHHLYGEYPPTRVSENPTECSLDGAVFDLVLDTGYRSADTLVTNDIISYLRETMGYDI